MNLPLGNASFGKLRRKSQIYVDKTDLVYDLASREEIFFLARPRRFGKSLLVSTFESLFTNGLKDFEGLKIENLWKDQGKYVVVHLDFSLIKFFNDSKEFAKKFTSLLVRRFGSAGFNYVESNLFSVTDQLSDWLIAQPENSLVILIDEYDSPLTSCLDSPDLFNAVRAQLSEFYSVIKATAAQIRFAFITGITKFNKLSLFSDLNNAIDISIDSKFGTILGYTPDEVDYYFRDYLNSSSTILGMDAKALKTELVKHYNGFCFERSATRTVFSPWSLLNFFAAPHNGFVNYWYESGGRPTVLRKYLKTHFLSNPIEYGKPKSINLSTFSGSSDLENLTDVGLLTQAGYLTIKSVKYGNVAFVDYPNLEVRQSIAQLYEEQLLGGKVAGQVGAGGIAELLASGNAEDLMHLLNKLFCKIDFQNYPAQDEASVRAIVQVFFCGAGLDVKVENHNAHGRSDLEVTQNNRHWVLEFKVSRENDSPEKILTSGVEQMLERKYGLQSDQTEIIRMVLVFSTEKREFVRWRQVF